MNKAPFADNDKNKPDNFVRRHSLEDQKDWSLVFAAHAFMIGFTLLLWFGVMYYGLVALEAVR